MKYLNIVLVPLMILAFFGCRNIEKNSNINEESETNIATINLEFTHINNETPDIFPDLPENLAFKINMGSFCSGSFSSVDIYASDTVDNIFYSLKVFLPSGEGFGMIYKNDGGIGFDISDFPYTLNSDDYMAYDNVLDHSENYAHAVLEVTNSKTSEYDFLEFTLDELTIKSLYEKEYLLNGEFIFKGHSHSYSLGQYGGCNAEITMLFSDLEMSVMLVD